ncbi:polyadenylate-binding protein RBP45 isoform X1 [Amborella trichopoda]|uniref:polyadenylate-binding protein RBP45 isoform X1 n=1 Tax=Amborella trichopoda TaxID=13333 RepID=UPI0005D38CDF|nr:polyadenylate-binding protein RBP45 isoform X1 [Amborella trichopoda]|eukprot:XP_011628460.1 polyadenylate-binding protein RBP45 isoform X1 [Amborella trichopoda]
MMQQPGQGVVPPSMAPPPMDPQQQQPPPQQQPWMMMPPQPHPQQPLPQPVNPQASHMWNQQPQPQPQVQPQAQAQPMQVQYSMQPASADEVRTLWIGDLQYWMDEAYIHSCFAHTGEVLSVKIIRNKQTGQPEGYGFIEFASRATAERIIQTVNGTTMPNTEQSFRLNWATFGGGDKRSEGTDFPVFVGDLASDVTDYLLQETFRSHYSSVKGAKVVTDRLTGRSKGYGFVRFGDENEQLRAMTEMNGVFCSTRPMRIGPATTKKTVGVQQQYPAKAPYQSNPQASQSESDPNNTTIFVGGLDPNVNDDILKQVFGQYGELIHVKIPVGKRCGFVQFANRACAEEALLMLNGTQLGQQSIRLSWGRSPSNKQDSSGSWPQPQADPNQWNGGAYYGYNQGYETYGYAPPPQDPAMYAYGGYPGYGNYQQQQ